MKPAFFKKLALFFRREKFNQELEEEMAWHRDQKSQDLLSAGASPADAQHAARREFGNDLHLREQVRTSSLFGLKPLCRISVSLSAS